MRKFLAIALITLFSIAPGFAQEFALADNTPTLHLLKYESSTETIAHRYRRPRDPAKDQAAFIMVGGGVLALGGGALLIANPDPNSTVNQLGMKGVVAGGLFSIIGAYVSLVLHIKDSYGMSVVTPKNEIGIAYSFK